MLTSLVAGSMVKMPLGFFEFSFDLSLSVSPGVQWIKFSVLKSVNICKISGSNLWDLHGEVGAIRSLELRNRGKTWGIIGPW